VNIIFLGTPAFAVPTLRRLTQSRHRIILVITQPDRPRNRGMLLTPPPIKQAASDCGIPILQPEKASSPAVVEEVQRLAPDAAVVVAYGQLLRRNFLTIPRRGCINLHASLLPKYRGSSPIQASLLAGDRETGVTTMLLNEGMDTGDILLQKAVEIGEDDTAGTLHDKLAELGASLMVETLDGLEEGKIHPEPQDESKASITRKFSRGDAKIDWNQPPARIHGQVRAFNPWPGCETSLSGAPLKIWKAAPAAEAGSGEPGEVIVAEKGVLLVQAAGGTIRILQLQAPGGKRMSADEFLRGRPIALGSILGA
jgi:methionyl-tRNA formyltransferase